MNGGVNANGRYRSGFEKGKIKFKSSDVDPHDEPVPHPRPRRAGNSLTVA
jgi:hypothetical protein